MTSDPIISKNNVNTSTTSLNHRKNHQRSIDLSSSSSSSTSYHSFSSLSSSSPSPSSPFHTPSTSTSATTTHHYHRHHLNNLPSDPKNWTSKDVSEYLYYCLQSFSSQYQQKVILELTNYIKQDTVNFSGRKFLRLKEEQLKQMKFGGNDDDWINLIMIGVKSLRRETLKEKILLKNDNNNNNKQHDVNNEQKGYFDHFFDDDGDYNNEESDSNKNDDKKEKEKHANDENKSIKRSYYSNGFLQGLIIGGIIMFAFMRIK